MPVIFISYRRSDSQDVTGRIYDRLTAKLSPKQVFKDVDNIPLGVSFPMHLKQMLSKANVVLVIIGPTWVNATDEQGRRRLDDPSDFVRVEVEIALRGEMPVIPVLVANARMPLAGELPPSLRKMVERNGMAVRPDPDFNNDIDRLFSGLEHLERLLKAAKGAIPVVTPVKEVIPVVTPVKDEIPVVTEVIEIEVDNEKPVSQTQKNRTRLKPKPRKETQELPTKPEPDARPHHRGWRYLMFVFLFVVCACGGAFVAYEAFTTPAWRDLKPIADAIGRLRQNTIPIPPDNGGDSPQPKNELKPKKEAAELKEKDPGPGPGPIAKGKILINVNGILAPTDPLEPKQFLRNPNSRQKVHPV